MYVVIAGAGTVGSYIAELLLKKGHEVAIVDKNGMTLDRLNESLDIVAYDGDATDRDLLKRVHIGRADLFVAATNIDEVNLTACAIAKRLGAHKNLARVRDDSYYRNRDEILSIFNIEMIFSPENLTAIEILNLIKTPGAYMVESFARGRAQMRTVRVENDSPAQGRRLSELDFPKDCIMAAIKRDEWFHIPSGFDTLFVNDVLYLVGKPNALDETETRLSRVAQGRYRSRRVFIYGESDVVPKLARKLEDDRFEVKLLVHDQAAATAYSEELQRSTVIRASSTDVNVFREERIDKCDVFVGASKEADKNIIAVTLARNMGAKSVIVLVDNMDYYRVAEQLGIGHIMSSRILTANSILRYIMKGNISSVTVLEEGKAEMIEMIVSSTSPAAGNPVMGIGFPREAVIATLVRGDEIIIPRGDTKVMGGDTAIIFTHPKNIKKIEKLFSGM